ncbi:FAD:protein FMN transferase [Falsibacillus albus]|nr:FAD:protein FMN transferase [Falsibacillus albus]
MMTQFTAMNSTIKLVGLNEEMQQMVEQLFQQFEQTASRFIPGNALAHLNESPLHVPIHLEETLADLLQHALKLSRRVEYHVNPFIGEAMKSIGYTNSFYEGYNPSKPNRRIVKFLTEPIEQISRQWIVKKENFTFDFGGFGKGYIVDKAKQLLLQEGQAETIINAGGDMAVIGRMKSGIEHPGLNGKDIARFYIKDCALATSSKKYRKWALDGESVHHIINGRTGKVARNGVLQASVIADTAMEAETISKVFCILPFEEAKRLVRKTFPNIAYFIYFDNHTFAVGGNERMYEELEVAK